MDERRLQHPEILFGRQKKLHSRWVVQNRRCLTVGNLSVCLSVGVPAFLRVQHANAPHKTVWNLMRDVCTKEISLHLEFLQCELWCDFISIACSFYFYFHYLNVPKWANV